MSKTTLRNKDYTIIGKLLAKRFPDIAEGMLAQIAEDIAIEKDFNKIDCFFLSFCGHLKLDPNEYTGPVLNREKNETRKVFVGAITHLYFPEAFHHPADILVIRYGFFTGIAKTLKIHQVNAQRIVQKAIFNEKAYEDFKEKVAEMLESLKPICNASA